MQQRLLDIVNMKKIFITLIILFSLGNAFCLTLTEKLKYYKAGDEFYEQGDYKQAIQNYFEFIKSYDYRDSINARESGYGNLDKNGTIKESYFSLYNIACCYNLSGDLENASLYLKYSIVSGYPFLEHIFKDPDLTSLFQSNKKLKREIEELYEEGNDNSSFHNKMIIGQFATVPMIYCYKDNEGNDRFNYYEKCLSDITETVIYGKGKYNYSNYKLELDFEEYKSFTINHKTQQILENPDDIKKKEIYWYEFNGRLFSEWEIQ